MNQIEAKMDRLFLPLKRRSRQLDSNLLSQSQTRDSSFAILDQQSYPNINACSNQSTLLMPFSDNEMHQGLASRTLLRSFSVSHGLGLSNVRLPPENSLKVRMPEVNVASLSALPVSGILSHASGGAGGNASLKKKNELDKKQHLVSLCINSSSKILIASAFFSDYALASTIDPTVAAFMKMEPSQMIARYHRLHPQV